jgi:FKBP-type peptidyl-prolyl cis-trans isomerase
MLGNIYKSNRFSFLKSSLVYRLGMTIISGLLIVSCAQEPEHERRVRWTREQSTELSKVLAEQEEVDIQLYVERLSHLKFENTGSGLRMAFVKDSVGEIAKPGQRAYVSFKMSLLNGSLCYSSDEHRSNDFIVDRSEVESGIQEAIKKMSVGDSCKVITPSHLAHGLTGDLNKIPPLTPLVIDLKMIRLR